MRKVRFLSKVIFTLTLTILSVNTQVSWGGTVLGNLAASMPAGTWAELPTNASSMYNLLYQMSSNGTQGSILEYAYKGAWDSTGRKLYFEGGAHTTSNDYAPWIFMQYDDATNTWSKSEHGPTYPGGTGYRGHAYAHNTISQTRREFYHKWEEINKVSKYNIVTGQWSLTSLIDPYSFFYYGTSFEFMDGRNRLICPDPWGSGNIWEYNPDTNVWTSVRTPFSGQGNESLSAYSRKHGVAIFGWGSYGGQISNFHRYTDAGVYTNMGNAPFAGKINDMILTVDPVSGDFLALTSLSTNRFYSYNPITNVWTPLNATGVPIFNYGWGSENEVDQTIAIPIDNYGVVMFISWNNGSPHVWLYKHASGPPPPPPPPGGSLSPIFPSGMKVQ